MLYKLGSHAQLTRSCEDSSGDPRTLLHPTHFCSIPRTFGIGHGVLAKWFFGRFHMLRTFSTHPRGYVPKGFGRSLLGIACIPYKGLYTNAPTENRKRQDLFRETIQKSEKEKGKGGKRRKTDATKELFLRSIHCRHVTFGGPNAPARGTCQFRNSLF